MGKDFNIGHVRPKTLKWTVVSSNLTFDNNGKHNDKSALCLYSVTAWGGMPLVCATAFQPGSKMVLFHCYNQAMSPYDVRILMLKNAVQPQQPSSYSLSLNLCSDTVVDGVCKIRIFIQCSCLIAPLCGYMNRHCENPGCSFKTLEGRTPIGYYAVLFHVVTSTFS